MLTPFQKKALDFTKHISLTANAGSGKTYVLSKRFVEIALHPSVNLKNIVAITFTEKAAGELYKKIAEEIEERILIEKNEEIKRKLISLRKYLVSANISTIHSFCLNILKEYAPQAGIDAAFIPVDSTTSSEIIDLSIEELFHQIDDESETGEKLKKLTRILGSRKKTVSELKRLIHSRQTSNEICSMLNNFDEASLEEYYQNLFTENAEEIFNFNFREIISIIGRINDEVKLVDQDNKLITPVNEFISKFDVTKNIFEQFEYFQSQPEFLTQKYTLKKSWIKKVEDIVLSEIKFLEEKFSQIIELSFDKDYDESITSLASFNYLLKSVYESLSEIYSQKKRERSALDFEDMLMITRDLLEREDVQNELAQKYQYIMIDEYQDTNELQYRIMMPILHNLDSGNLFVVGDEKQSIYRFRGAEPEIFETTKFDIGNKSTNDSILSLPHSFRMAPNISGFVNYVFSKLFEKRNEIFNEIPYQELICGRDENDGGIVEFLIPGDDKTTEIDLVVSRILKLKEEDPKFNFGKAAILCRKRKWFEPIVKAFTESGIPYTIVGGKGFYNQPIIYDITNYLSFLINPSNDFALAVILRSPFFSFSDIELFEMSQCPGERYFEKLNFYCNGKKNENVLSLLEDHLDKAKSLEIPKIIRKILKDTGYMSVVASKQNSDQDLANIEKLVSLASIKSAKGFITLYDFVDFLSTAAQQIEDEGHAVINHSDNSVKVMTIHQSKGLEFDTVILFNSHENTKPDTVSAKAITIDKRFGFLTKLPETGNYFNEYKMTYIGSLYDYIEKRKQSAEIKRLFYVAATRAENHLIISGGKTKDSYSKDSFLNFCESVFGKTALLESNNIKISVEQEFMKNVGDKFDFIKKELEIMIPIIKSVSESSKVDIEKVQIEQENLEIDTSEIIDKEENEIVSATKIATFTQCPVKYQLTYEIGYGKLLSLLNKSDEQFDFKYIEDSEEKLNPNIKGSVLHKILEEEVEENLQDLIRRSIEAETGNINSKFISQKEIENLEKSINNFVRSNLWKYIKSFPMYFKEYEIYSKQENYFLYGIIDRLIIDENKVIIIDYKSDSFDPAKLDKKGEHYLPQLMFYALVVSKQLMDINEFELRLAFIEHPELEFKKNINKEELTLYERQVQNVILKIRDKIFEPNFDHCKECHYSPDKKNCVKSF